MSTSNTSLLARIKSDQFEARKARSEPHASLLTTLYAEAAIIGKDNGNRESTDDEVMAVVKKFVKNINICLAEAASMPADSVEGLKAELGILMEYLPAQLTEDQIRDILWDMSEQHKLAEGGVGRVPLNVGKIMKHFKDNYNGQYDAKQLSQIAGDYTN